MRNLVHLVDDGVGQGEAEVGIALADSKVVVGVGVEPVLGVDQWGPGSERSVDVVDERKVLPLDLDRRLARLALLVSEGVEPVQPVVGDEGVERRALLPTRRATTSTSTTSSTPIPSSRSTRCTSPATPTSRSRRAA